MGEEKYNVEVLKKHDSNLSLLKIVEASREDVNKMKTKSMSKIAEDDEYEYYIEKPN